MYVINTCTLCESAQYNSYAVNSTIVKLIVTFIVMVFGRCSPPEALAQLLCIHDSRQQHQIK